MTTRLEELFKKGKSLTVAEKIELANLLNQDAETGRADEIKAVAKEVLDLINGKGVSLAEVIKVLTNGENTDALFKVPYTDSKGGEKFYYWWVGKKAVGVSSQYANKLKNASAEQKKQWATPKGLEWLEKDEGKRFLVKAD